MQLRHFRLKTIATALAVLTFTSSSCLTLAQQADPLQNFYRQTIDSFDKNLKAARQSGFRWQEVDVLRNAGTAHRSVGNFQKSLDLLQQAYKIAQEIKDQGRTKDTLKELAATHSKLGDYLGIKFYEQQLQVAKKSGDPNLQAALFEELGTAYLMTTNYLKVVEVYEQYLPIVRQSQNGQQLDLALSVLSSAYRALGEKQKASNLQEQRLALARQSGNKEVELTVLSELAIISQYKGDRKRATDLFQQALQLAQQTNSVRLHPILFEMSRFYASLGDSQKTLDLLNQSLIVAQKANDSYSTSLSLDGLSRAYSLLENYPKAIDLQKQRLAIYEKMYPPSERPSFSEAESLSSLGVLQFRAKQPEAKTTLESALKAQQLVRTRSLSNANLLSISRDDLNLNLREQVADIYRTLQQILIAEQQTDKALELSEEGRSRAFIDLLASRVTGGTQAVPTIAPPNLAQMRQIAKTHRSTLVQYSLAYSDVRFALFRFGEQQPQETNLLIWVIKPNGEVAFKQVDLTAASLRIPPLTDLVTTSRALIGTGNRGFTFNEAPEVLQRAVAETRGEAIEELQQLHQVLIQPIADLLPKHPSDRVTFIPQDSLFLVPFAALQDPSGKYLIEKHTILTAPSIQALDLTRQQRQKLRPGNKSVLVIGNPIMPKVRFQANPPQQLASLPGAEKEAKAIAALLKTQPILGAKATEATVVQQMPKARMIHLATHGLLDHFVGFQSALALTPSGNDDGLLTAREILNLKLNAELVVLSACDTGRGRISGDGVIGLSRSLISAGAASVIVSLWKVPDAPTASLMTEFYRNLQKQPDKAQALRQSMLTTMKQYPAPRDWAAFTLIGEAE